MLPATMTDSNVPDEPARRRTRPAGLRLASARALAVVVAGTIGLALGACEASPPPRWQVVHRHLAGGLLSVWGRSAADVWTVGGDDGEGPTVLHLDGGAWTRVPTGDRGDLWWVHGWDDGTVMVSGADGRILRWDGAEFRAMDTPAHDAIVFGLWGPTPDDVFAVGGVGRSAGFVWHWDGAAWSTVALPSSFDGRSLFKVWGTASDDAWVCGTDGALMHWDGAALTDVPSGTTRTLFTVHALGDRVAAVGGLGAATIVERGPRGFTDVTPPLAAQLFGVALGTAGAAWGVGLSGTVVHDDGTGWALLDTRLDLGETLHGVWIDPDGGVWAAGGQVLATPLRDGALVYFGTADMSPEP